MPILISKYIDIGSGVASGASVAARELIGRILSTSAALQPGVVVEFEGLSEVGEYFADNTPEYRFAAKYFGFVSKTTNGAKKLSMSRWAKTAAAAQITGGVGAFGASVLDSLTDANILHLVVTDGSGAQTTADITVNLSGLDSYEAVRAALQTAIRAQVNPLLAQANVLYTAATGVFTFQSGSANTQGSVVAVADEDESKDVGYWINWTAARGALSSPQTAAQSPLEAVQVSLDISDNFGSFGFIDSTVNPRVPLTLAQTEAVAAWNNAQNVKFMFCSLVTIADASTWYASLGGIGGLALSTAANDFAEFAPMIVLASVDYSRVDASTNYMFQQFPDMTPSVDNTTISNTLDSYRVNYVGSVMQAGRKLSFYQRGVLCGGQTSPVDMATYCNEIWLKDNIVVTLLTMLLTLSRVPANEAGRTIVMSNVQQSVTRAVNNGVISVGKLLTDSQKQQITNLTNDTDAWQQVQTVGYWLNVWIDSVVTSDGRTEYVAKYHLIYSKDDQIRKVEGTNTLI